MREIKFRAWDSNRGIMLVNHTFASLADTGLGKWEGLEWMQYTGIKDRYGKEIYEGDVLKFDPAEWGGEDSVFIVEWDNHSTGWSGYGVPSDWPQWCEVIGNIYNPSNEPMQTKDILKLKLSGDFEGTTIRGYLSQLLTALWDEGEGFNSKRPFGNSAWEYDLYLPLIKAGVVEGKLDQHGYIEDMDRPAANIVIFKCIDDCFKGT